MDSSVLVGITFTGDPQSRGDQSDWQTMGIERAMKCKHVLTRTLFASLNHQQSAYMALCVP